MSSTTQRTSPPQHNTKEPRRVRRHPIREIASAGVLAAKRSSVSTLRHRPGGSVVPNPLVSSQRPPVRPARAPFLRIYPALCPTPRSSAAGRSSRRAARLPHYNGSLRLLAASPLRRPNAPPRPAARRSERTSHRSTAHLRISLTHPCGALIRSQTILLPPTLQNYAVYGETSGAYAHQKDQEHKESSAMQCTARPAGAFICRKYRQKTTALDSRSVRSGCCGL